MLYTLHIDFIIIITIIIGNNLSDQISLGQIMYCNIFSGSKNIKKNKRSYFHRLKQEPNFYRQLEFNSNKHYKIWVRQEHIVYLQIPNKK